MNNFADDTGINPIHTRIGVIGLGYVGLPLIVEFGLQGFNCVGIDVDLRKVEAITSGKSYIEDVPQEDVDKLVKSGKLRATGDYSVLRDVDVIIACVPTPLKKTKDPDISHILAACKEVAKYLKQGHLVILESTTFPGTTDSVVLPLFEETGMTVGKDFFLAFSPERVDPGNRQFGIKDITKIVGGVTPECTKRAVVLYSHAIRKVLPTSNARVAEAAKLVENTYRSVNIALANEFALIFQHLGIDVWEVIEAAATKPFGFQPFFPGPGVGGHCIPLDPYYLSWRARMSGFEARLIGLAGEINYSMPRHVVGLVADALNGDGKSIKNSKILVLGVAYKKNVSDVRESPALEIMELLAAKGADLHYCDPFVPTLSVGGHLYESLAADSVTFRSMDCVVVITNHDSIDYDAVAENAPLVVDTRNALKNACNNITRVVKL